MKFIHLSDLHLGKRVNEFSMMEDQKYILTKIVNIIDDEKPDAVLIAGDLYDKSVPPVEAVALLDDFLGRLAKRSLQVFIISGNHDSPERVAFASGLIEPSGIHISPAYGGSVKPFTMKDEHGAVCIYMLPFVKPAHVRSAFPDEEIGDYTDAVRIAVSHMEVDESQRNVLLTHQFVTGAQTSDSEERSVGGLDQVDASVYDAFDYVALGHLHGPQKVGRQTLRYSGSPLKYSFSEAKQQKSVTVVELEEKGNVRIRTRELIPLRDMRELKGSYEELTNRKNYEGTQVEDYLKITLTDEEDIFEAMAKLRGIYPNLMRLSYDNKRTREERHASGASDVQSRSPIELFEEFYELQNNQAMSGQQRQFTLDLIEKIWEERA
ncbi:MAG: exonuclease SbcCD subunit D [Lachnospiraceae bacterium]|nr:exonuclease SbcCD subunit D [Lachnospiraceae bacterium]